MSDWTSAFQGFREGMGMLQAANARKKQEQMEQDRLQLERARSESDSETAKLNRLVLQNRLDRLVKPPTVPEGFQIEGFDADGAPKMGRVPLKPTIVTMDDGSSAYYNPNTGEFKPKEIDYTSLVLGGGPTVKRPQVAPQAVPASEGDWRPPMQLPGVNVTKPNLPAAGDAATRRPVVTGLSGGKPTIEFQSDPTAPVLRTFKDANGKEYTYFESTNAKGQKEFTKPEASNSKLSADDTDKITLAFTAMDALPKMAQDIEKFGTEGGPLESKLGSIGMWMGGEPSEARRTFDQAGARTLTPIAKGILGETGALSEQEQARYGSLIPTFQDTQDARRQKFGELKQQVAQAAKNRITLMKQNGQDTAAIEAEFARKMQIIDDAQNGIPNFNTEAEAEAAVKSGALRIQPNQKIRIGGQLTQYTP